MKRRISGQQLNYVSVKAGELQSTPMDIPLWAKDLPAHINLSPSQVERLEIIRSAVGLGQDEFHLHVRTHPECSKMLQRELYSRYRREHPGMSDEYYLGSVVWSRYATAQMTGFDLFGLRAMLPDAEALNDPTRALAAVTKVVREHGWQNIEQVAQAIMDEESLLPAIATAAENEEAARQVTLVIQERVPSN